MSREIAPTFGACVLHPVDGRDPIGPGATWSGSCSGVGTRGVIRRGGAGQVRSAAVANHPS